MSKAYAEANARKKKKNDEANNIAKSVVNKTVSTAKNTTKAVSVDQRQPSVSQTRQKTVDRLNQKYGQNKAVNQQPKKTTQPISQKVQSTNERLTEKYGTGKVTGGKRSYMDDVVATAKSTLRQTAAEEGRALNTAARGITQKDAWMYASQDQIDKANKRSEERDAKFRAKIKQESAEMEKLKQGHSYLGQQGLSAVSSTVGMATDAAWGPASLAHMFLRTSAGAQGNVKEKVEPLKQKLAASGTYSQDEIDEMFKDVDKWDLANSVFEGGIEVLSEKMFGGFGIAKKVGGTGILDKSLAKLGARMGSKATTGILGNIARGTAEEIAEEEVGGPLQALASNLIYGNRLQEINEDATRRTLQAQSDDLRSRITNEQDAQAIAAQLGSREFIDDSKSVFLESGVSEKEAEELAEMSRDYLTAAVTGDTETMRQLQDEMVNRLAGGDNSFKERFTMQDAIDAAVSTAMMTAVTGAPGAITTSRMGEAYRDTNGMDAVRNLAQVTKNLDPDKSIQAQAILDRIDAGEDVSGTQVYQLIEWSSQAATESYRREDAKERMADRVMKQENLFVAPSVRNEDGSVTLGEETERRYDEQYEEALKTAKEKTKDIDKDDLEIGADVSTAFLMGTITANQMNELSIDNDAIRAVFHEVTDINLDQFKQYDSKGNLDVAESNIAMQEALFAKAADNYIESARLEQENWNDGARGEVVSAITADLGTNGDAAVHDALNAVDPRDRSTFILMGRAAQNVYDYSRYSEDSWDDVKSRLKGMYPSLPQDALKGVYEAAKEDKAVAETPYYNAIVKADTDGSQMDMSEANQAEYGKFTNEAQRQLKDSEQIILQSLARQFNINIKLLPSKDFKIKSQDENGKNKVSYSNGSYDPKTGTMLLNGGNDMERNIIAVALHEITHHIAVYAPDEYLALSNKVMDRWYKNDAEAFKAAIQRKQENYRKAVKQDLTEEQALEEVIADAIGEMNADPEFINQICREEPTLADRIIDAIKDVLRKLRQILSSGRVADEYEDAFFSQLDMWDEAQRLWMNAAKAARQARAEQMIDAWENNALHDSRKSLPDELIQKFGGEAQVRFSITTENDDNLPKGGALPSSLKKWAKEVGLDTLTKQDVKAPVQVSVRDLRTAWYEMNGRNEEAETINKALESVGDALTNLVGEYQYIDLSDALNATVHYRTDAEGKPTSVILSCQVKNAEYEVNFDFTTICAKRLAMQKVLEKFIKTEGESKGTLYDELKLDEEGMYKLRLILEQAGFEVSCRGCFVEQNRYSQQSQARTIANDWNAALDAWAAENGTEVTENFDLVNMDINSLDYDEIERGFKRYHELMSGKSANVETKNRMLIESSPFFRKRMNSSDYASLSGQRALMAIGESKKGGTSLYGLLKRGQSDSKQSVPFTAYNGEVALLPDKMKGKELYDYLLSIGGARAQSASDFQIEFLYDYMQLVADLSARGLPMHMYTKVIELAELFGMTGIKINLSAMCDVDPELTGEYAGLKLVDGKYEYNISDQSIDYPKAVELQKKDGYSKNIGIIMVVLSSQHMLKSLDDPDVRYIIGYHSSAMPVVVANMSKMGDATDYTKLNKTSKLTDKGRALFDQAMQEAEGEGLNKYKNALRIFEEKIQEDVSTKKNKPRRGNEYGSYVTPYKGNTADFNTYEDILKTNDARKTADNYIEWCMNNDYIPMYFPFAFHENYYKCEVYDFNMYDNVSGEYAPMQGVQNIYPGLNMAAGETDTTSFMNRVSEMMADRNKFNEVQSAMYEPVFEQAKQELRYSITGDDYMDFDASGIDHSELVHRADAPKTEMQMRDDAYMDAVNNGNMDEAQRLVDEAAEASMPNTKLKGHWYHGTNNNFNIFDFSEGGKNGTAEGYGIYLAQNPEISSVYGSRLIDGYVNMTRPASSDKRTITKAELKKLIKASVEQEARAMVEEGYDSVDNALRDTWISNYTYTYDKSLTASIAEVANSIISMNDNDMDIVQEVMAGRAIYNYDQASEFYDMLTSITGIDGFVTEWENVGTGEKNTIALAFRSNQIKLSDPVTYAEDGSVIPLSERFDTSNDDIRYSLPTVDTEGNVLSNGQLEYFRNTKATDEQGRLIPMYHVTPIGGFTIFDPAYSSDQRSISFTNDMDFALNYSSEDEDIDAYRTAYETRLGDGKTTGIGHYKTYLNMQNPYIVDGSDIVFNDEVAELTAYAQSEGYDGLIMRNFQDLDVDIYQVFSSNQIKDTRNTDPTENPDIRYSIVTEDETMDRIAAAAESLENIPLRDPVLEEGRIRLSISEDDFKAKVASKWNEADLTYGMVLNEASIKRNLMKMMGYVMKESGTGRKYKSETLNETIQAAKVMFYLMKSGKVENAADYAWKAASRIVDNIDYNDDLYVKYKDLREYLGKTKIAVPEGLEVDEDFAEFARDNYGRMLLKDKGRQVDSVYKSLTKKWPAMFATEITDPVDQLLQIDYVLDYIQPYREAYTSEEYTKLVDQVATSLLDIVSQGEEYQSVADVLTEKFDAQTKAMKQRHQEALHRVLAAEKEKRQRQAERAEMWKRKYHERIQKNIEERQERKERADHRKKFEGIQDDYNWLTKAVLDPTKDKYIPEAFRKSLADLLVQIDLQTENSKALEEKYGRVAVKTLKMRELRDRLNELSSKRTQDDTNLFDIDAYLPYLMDSLANKVDGQSIDSMDLEDINTVRILFKALRKNFQNLNRETEEAKAAKAEKVASSIVAESMDKVRREGMAKTYAGAKGAMNTINMTSLTPAYLFERLGSMNDMYKELRSGFDTYIQNEAYITERLKGILGKYYKQRNIRKNKPKPGSELEEWRDSRSAVELELTNGAVTMTAAQRMSLYLLGKRTQATKHMYVGGIVITPIQPGSKIEALKERTKGKAELSERIIINEADLKTIETSLTKDQINIANQLQQLMAVDMARLGNEAHREMYGYEIFGEPDYFPIRSKETWVPKDVNNMNDAVEKIKSFGPAKPLDVNASNAIVVDDIFTVVADHCNGMNLYNAYLVPISNFMRVYNYTPTLEDGSRKPVREAMQEAYGSKTMQYIDNFIRDINGIKNNNRGGLEDIMNKALGRAKKTAVFGNIRVALQQPTAVVRAFAEMDPKYFAPFLKVAPEKGVREEMYKYAPIAQWKSWGYYDTYMGRDIEDVMMNTWSASDVALSGIYGELDNWTWSLIWRAVKAEQAEAHPNMDTKSEEFLKLCGERASEVFDKTQVVDSTFHRSDAMRNKQVAVKTFTAFMSEPTLTMNVLRAGIFRAQEMRKRGNKAEANKILARAISVVVLQAAIVSAAQAFADAWRGKDPGLPGGDDDDDKDERYWVRWIHNYLHNMIDQLHLENNIYLVKDLKPFADFAFSRGADYFGLPEWAKAILGWDQEYLYSNNNLVYAGAENLAQGVGQIFKKLEKGDDYDKSWYDIIQKTSSGLGTFIGIPIGTLMRDTKPIWDKIFETSFALDIIPSEEVKQRSPQITGIQNGSTIDNVLNFFGVNLSEEELVQKEQAKIQKERDEKVADIIKKTESLSGEAKDKKVWSYVTTYLNEQNEDKPLSDFIQDGDYKTVNDYREMYLAAGGRAEYFDSRIFDTSKKALKLSIINDPTDQQIEAQNEVKDYLLSHGMTEAEMSEIAYKSNTAKDLKAAFRLNDEDAIVEELIPLIRAGLSYEDFEKLYQYRNSGRTSYKGKYKDRFKSTGKYVWPAQGQITSGFGYRNAPTAGASSYHQAIDIGASMGSPVVAADGGTVIFAGWNGAGGKTVKIQHDDGTITYYQHLSWWDAKVGDVVGQGQTIGNVGSTGVSTGPHLDFRVEINGEFVDPMKYLNS